MVLLVSEKLTSQLLAQLNQFQLKIFSNETNQLILESSISFSSPKLCSQSAASDSSRDKRVAVASSAGVSIITLSTGLSRLVPAEEELLDFVFDPTSSGHRGFAISKTHLMEWNVEKEKLKRTLKLKNNLSKMCINGEGSLIAIGSSTIDVVDVKTWKIIKSFAGHATGILDLTFGPDNSLFSCAREDRFISQWSLEGDSTIVYVVDSPPLKLSVKNHIAALLENGTITIWTVSKPKGPRGIFEFNAQDVESDAGFLGVSITSDGTHLFVCYGNKLDPKIEKVSFLDNESDIKSMVLNRAITNENAPKPKKSKKASKLPRIVGANDIHEDEAAEMRNSQQPPQIISETSMEDQVRALMINAPSESKQASQTSLQALLTQAVYSGDVQLLEKALVVSDRKVVHATIQRMAPQHILLLLDQIVFRLQKRPNRAAVLVEWIRACLLHHSGYLLSVPHLTQRLGSLYRTLNARQDAMSRLMRLSGRLDMVSSQMDVFPLAEEEEGAAVFNGDDSDKEDDEEVLEEEEEEDDEEFFSEEELDF